MANLQQASSNSAGPMLHGTDRNVSLSGSSTGRKMTLDNLDLEVNSRHYDRYQYYADSREPSPSNCAQGDANYNESSLQLLKQQIQQAHQSSQVSKAQVQLLRDQLAAETTARLEAQARTQQLLAANSELIVQVSVLVTRLRDLESSILNAQQPSWSSQTGGQSSQPTGRDRSSPTPDRISPSRKDSYEDEKASIIPASEIDSLCRAAARSTSSSSCVKTAQTETDFEPSCTRSIPSVSAPSFGTFDRKISRAESDSTAAESFASSYSKGSRREWLQKRASLATPIHNQRREVTSYAADLHGKTIASSTAILPPAKSSTTTKRKSNTNVLQQQSLDAASRLTQTVIPKRFSIPDPRLTPAVNNTLYKKEGEVSKEERPRTRSVQQLPFRSSSFRQQSRRHTGVEEDVNPRIPNLARANSLRNPNLSGGPSATILYRIGAFSTKDGPKNSMTEAIPVDVPLTSYSETTEPGGVSVIRGEFAPSQKPLILSHSTFVEPQ